ncbi:hypothetical protein HCN44_010639 [Aphidius gifuensis]|uniref:RRM domain-containing protein n=1 Tax=Aphidius gifuensis TaxID=684658 RepID=A0A834XSU7_APHGI|nr:hrp65 protein-like [Aphidius gifuensis]KAF7991838.1 hypothetical protein HCN44_010639 [Aphidius gifuensis]
MAERENNSAWIEIHIKAETKTEDILAILHNENGGYVNSFRDTFNNILFVEMTNLETAVNLIDYKLNGEHVVHLAPFAKHILIKNLPEWINNDQLQQAFQVFGIIQSSRLATDLVNNPQGEAVIEYADYKSSVAAVETCKKNIFHMNDEAIIPVDADHIFKKFVPDETVVQFNPRVWEEGTHQHREGSIVKQTLKIHEQRTDLLNTQLKNDLKHIEDRRILLNDYNGNTEEDLTGKNVLYYFANRNPVPEIQENIDIVMDVVNYEIIDHNDEIEEEIPNGNIEN